MMTHYYVVAHVSLLLKLLIVSSKAKEVFYISFFSGAKRSLRLLPKQQNHQFNKLKAHPVQTSRLLHTMQDQYPYFPLFALIFIIFQANFF